MCPQQAAPHSGVPSAPRPLSEMSDGQWRELQEALLEVGSFEDLPGKWQAAVVEAEQNRAKLRVV